MWIGIDDTDSPEGMCTTYLGAVLARRLEASGIPVHSLRLIRLNPTIIWKTRGNAAIAIGAGGDPDTAFSIAESLIEELADLGCERTNPGLVVCGDRRPPAAFAEEAITGFCTIEGAIDACIEAGARYRGWKNGRGLIGAVAAVAAELDDSTSEYLVYRDVGRRERERVVDRKTLTTAEEMTHPHTWDTVDAANNVVVCVPHTPDPVLFGIRGENPVWVSLARNLIESEDPAIEALFETNQGTDAHLLPGMIGSLEDGRSYIVVGTVSTHPATGIGGHVSVRISDRDLHLTCMAYEPVKGFREIIRALAPGDRIVACGSYRNNTLNLEKCCILDAPPLRIAEAPICPECARKMTSAGTRKGYKCRRCGKREEDPAVRFEERHLVPGWYEVPPSARRHLARPLCRGSPPLPDNVVNLISDQVDWL
ncbi:tRNA(Ile2) 2-agmatinylcytidine synthetase [Methanocalculus chunghsingensis]|uniref:tRNA(Ile2) 2-agmatinylcytidine synthetase TiaS n=2 Tax=Methanocalculus chunghsingensis TaxID=156457 RepID=A0A8J7WBE2_9EURY|nr:tRNA(Ile)(2)-agmatinylcytidine synthase [Methanocalculus chunghsingensis]MBR1369633.1 tRNA(Ile2) 2-agmatinylcytidine synthetase [Methanocalculus chunghsingensis]